MANVMTNKEIKKAFQAKFPQLVFSVSTRHGGYSESVNITIKNFLELVTDQETYKQFASELIAFKDSLKIGKVYRDEHLQEIELGGNTYVNLNYKTEAGIASLPNWV